MNSKFQKIKQNTFFFFLLTILISCFMGCENQKKEQNKKWLEKNVLINNLIETTNYYHMYDSTNSKVGSMVFGTYFENGFFVARDTSLFDDGSVYETAEFKIDTTNLKMSQTRINFQFGKVNSVNISLNNNENRITGDYIIKKDTITNSIKVDSVYKYNIYRGELFMLLNTIKIQKGDSLNLNIFVPMQLNTSKVLITGLGEEKIKVPYYDDMQLCDRIKIKADGVMPDNIIWITKTEPRRMLKVHVPNNKLDIELVDVK